MASNEEDRYAARRYQKELPDDKTNLAKAWKLLESYSKIPPDEIESHVIAVREKAFAVHPYPCIGRWRFLDLYVTSLPEYPGIISRLRAGGTLLDLGCCFGQILRQLVRDGAPATNLVGSDLRDDYIRLGFDLFRDADTFSGRFVTGDILDPADAGLASLDGRFDVIHSASFFHLFGWDDQARIGERVVRFFKPDAIGADGGGDSEKKKGALLVGRQVGNPNPPSVEEWRATGEKGRYRHNQASLQHLWDVIGERTGTKWEVSTQMISSPDEHEDPRDVLWFAITKVG